MYSHFSYGVIPFFFQFVINTNNNMANNYFYVKEIILDHNDMLHVNGVIMVPDRRLAETHCLAYENHILNRRVFHAETKYRPGIICGALVVDLASDEVIMTLSLPVKPQRFVVHILYMLSGRNDKQFIVPIYKSSFDNIDDAIYKAGIHYLVHATWGYGGGLFAGVIVTDITSNVRIYQKIR